LGNIKNEVVLNVDKALNFSVPAALNKYIAAEKGFTEVYPNLDLDWSLTTAPTINANGLNFGIKSVDSAVAPPALPFKDASNPSQF